MRLATAVLLFCVTVTPALAQAPPSLAIEAPAQLASARTRLEQYDVQPLSALVRIVGLDSPGPTMRVVLADDASEWAGQVPRWAAGFAITDAGLIVLFPSRSPVYPHDTLEDVLRHEVAHVLIGRAASGNPVPRWFHEGLAVAVERPWALEDRTRLASALMFGPRLGLRGIDALFLGDESAQGRAYALSAALVRHLISEHGNDAPASVLRAVARGVPFDIALEGVAAQSLPRLEERFWDAQRTWTMWVPLIASSTAMWLGVIALGTLAIRRRRRRMAEIRRRWAQEEAAAATMEDVEEPQGKW